MPSPTDGTPSSPDPDDLDAAFDRDEATAAEYNDRHASTRDRKRRRAMPLHGKGYVRLMQQQLMYRGKKAGDDDNDE